MDPEQPAGLIHKLACLAAPAAREGIAVTREDDAVIGIHAEIPRRQIPANQFALAVPGWGLNHQMGLYRSSREHVRYRPVDACQVFCHSPAAPARSVGKQCWGRYRA